MRVSPTSDSAIRRIELILAIVVTLVVVVLLIIRTIHAGPLWRDECDTVQTAQLPTLKDVAANFQYDSFPLPFLGLVRLYTALFGASDASLRAIGLVVGMALIGAAWFNSRSLNADTPLLFLILAGLNTTFLVWGTSLRAYGLGSVLIVLGFGLTAKFLLQPDRQRLWPIFLAFLAAIQCLINDTVLVFAVSAAAMIVCLFRTRYKTALALFALLTACAISYLPYVPVYFKMGWRTVLQREISLPSLWQSFRSACGEPTSITACMWSVLIVLSLIGATCWLWNSRREKPTRQRDLLCFALSAVLISLIGYYSFLRLLSYKPHPWYYLPLLCLLAAAIDLIVANLCRFRWIRLARLSVAVVTLLIMPLVIWPQLVRARQTNMDLVTHALEQQASAKDLIILNPWYLGVSFNRYYHGTTRWLTVPTIAEHRVHRFDLLKEKMMAVAPLDDLKQVMAETLQRGNRVWFVGDTVWLSEEKVPSILPPAPQSQFGWSYSGYLPAWSQQLLAFAQWHAVRGDLILSPAKDVNAVENVSVWALQGWRD